MIIEDPESFKTWLTSVLKPICEADPDALAKYVIALVKKDKTPDALRESMINQLEVFLQSETVSFVNLLFKTLENHAYIPVLIPNANPPNPNVIKTELPIKPVKDEVRDVKPFLPVELGSVTDAVNGSAVVKKEEVKREKDLRKSDSEKEDKPRRRSRHRSNSRNRSRSRSWDRTRRSRSKEKSRERERDPHRADRDKRERVRPWRNKSPPRRYEQRRRSRTPSPGARVRSRSRSPRHLYRGRYRNRSPPRSTSRSRSRSIERKDRKEVKIDKDSKDPHSGAGTPTQDSNHGDMDLRLTNTTQSIQSVVAQQTGTGENRNNVKRRCRDYDEKGYCMRGEMCPFDHGVDPVVLEDTALTRVLAYAPNGTPVGDVPPTMLPPPIIATPGPLMHPMQPRPLPPEYNPQAPQMWHRTGFRGPRPILGPRIPGMGAFVPPPNMQRELIPVPVLDNKQNEQFNTGYQRQPQYNSNEQEQDSMFKKKGFDFNRLGPRSKNTSNCALELKKIPTGLNNITHLNNHFSKFGKIVNIQVCYENDPEAAIVTFSSHAEANAAYRSTEAVLNNRFIKVFWHSGSSDGKQENVPPRSVKDRLGMPNIVAPNSNKVLNLVQPKVDSTNQEDGENADKNANNFTKNNMRTDETKAQAAAAIKKNQELLAAKEKIKKNQEEKRKEALKLTQNLRKRKQELLEKQLAQQKLLIDKLEKTPAGPQRDLLMDTIKKTQEAIETIRKDMMTQPVVPAKVLPMRKSKEEAQKEVLDAELDLIAKQQEGADTSEIQKKILELRAKVATTRGRRSSRRYNPIVNRSLLSKNNLINNDTAGLKGNVKSINSFQKHAIDHRPTRLLVSGYEGDEHDSVLTHFGQFGEIVDYVSDAATPSIVLNYKTRKEAEVALIKGKHFQDRTLSITWCNNAQLNTQLSGRSSKRTVLVSESEEDNLIDQTMLEGEEDLGPELSEEVLLQDDEEEDEENEDRSWRR